MRFPVVFIVRTSSSIDYCRNTATACTYNICILVTITMQLITVIHVHFVDTFFALFVFVMFFDEFIFLFFFASFSRSSRNIPARLLIPFAFLHRRLCHQPIFCEGQATRQFRSLRPSVSWTHADRWRTPFSQSHGCKLIGELSGADMNSGSSFTSSKRGNSCKGNSWRWFIMDLVEQLETFG